MDPGASTDFQHEAVAPNGAVLLGFFFSSLAIRKLQRIVMSGDLVFVDLPKDRCLMLRMV